MSEPNPISCDVCGRELNVREVIQIRHHCVCADCKAGFIQRLKEGVAEDVSFDGKLDLASCNADTGRIVIDLTAEGKVVVPSMCPVTGEEGVHQHQICRLSPDRDVHVLVSDIGRDILNQTANIRGTILSLWAVEVFLALGLIVCLKMARANLADSTWVLAATFLCIVLFVIAIALLFLRLEDAKPPLQSRYVYGDDFSDSWGNRLKSMLNGCHGATRLIIDFRRSEYAALILRLNAKAD